MVGLGLGLHDGAGPNLTVKVVRQYNGNGAGAESAQRSFRASV